MEKQHRHPLYQARDFDGLFSTTWELYKKHFTLLFILSFLFSLLLSLPGSWLIPMDQLMAFETEPDLSKFSGLMGNLFLYLLIILAGYSLLYLLLHQWILRKEEEPDLSFGNLLGGTVSRFYLPYLLAVIMAGLILFVGTMLGVFLFIIGALLAAVYFSTVFFQLTPVMLVERRDPFASLGRCFNLVHNYFWPTIGQALVFMILYLIVSLLLGLLASAPYIGNIFSVLTNPEAANGMMTSAPAVSLNNPLMLILNAAVNGALFPFIPAFAIPLYFNLRAREEASSPFSDSEQNEEDTGSLP